MATTARKQRVTTSDRVDQSKPAFRIVDRAGGLTRFCELFDFPPSTVHHWLTIGMIPARKREGQSYAAYIIAKGREHGIDYTPADFVEAV